MSTLPQANDMLTTLSLIGSSTGTLKVTELELGGGLSWLLPSTAILEVLDNAKDQEATVQYDDRSVPVYTPNDDDALSKTLIIEGLEPERRLAIRLKKTQEFTIRISELPDASETIESPFGKETVEYQGRTIVVPDLNALTDHLYPQGD